MPKDRFKLIPEVYLLLFKENKTLLLKRANTGYEDGNYGLVAGHKEEGESATEAIIREAKEEAGIIINPSDVQFVHICHRKDKDERISFFFTANTWHGTIVNCEPHKCDELSWFPVDQLPANTIACIRSVLQEVRNGETYSEFGWEG
ncbi:MAG: hydrolase [Candidatus Peribacteria bacterium]|nr:hydrolase [Candidatus Peribacteria bacterium]